MVREAASKTNDLAGDGTTTATVLTHALVAEGIKLLEAGHNHRQLLEEIEAAVDEVLDDLAAHARPVVDRGDLARVATVSANGDAAMGELVAQAFEAVGRDGAVTVEDSKGTSTTLEVVEGTRFDRGYTSPYFVTDSTRMVVDLREVNVLLVDGKASSLAELIPVLESTLRRGRGLLVVADEVEQDVLQGLVVNKVNARLKVAAVRTPGHGRSRDDALADLAVLTGAKPVAPGQAPREDDLGKASRVLIDARTTTITGDGSTREAAASKSKELREAASDPTTRPDDARRMLDRAARLASGVAVVRVGGATEMEATERRHRLEDALNATRAAAEEGVVAGGGLALHRAGTRLSQGERTAGKSIVARAVSSPLRRIASNAGLSPEVVIDVLSRLPEDTGHDAATDTYTDMHDLGVIDPVKVTRTALRNAASVAATFLSLDAAIVPWTNPGEKNTLRLIPRHRDKRRKIRRREENERRPHHRQRSRPGGPTLHNLHRETHGLPSPRPSHTRLPQRQDAHTPHHRTSRRHSRRRGLPLRHLQRSHSLQGTHEHLRIGIDSTPSIPARGRTLPSRHSHHGPWTPATRSAVHGRRHTSTSTGVPRRAVTSLDELRQASTSFDKLRQASTSHGVSILLNFLFHFSHSRHRSTRAPPPRAPSDASRVESHVLSAGTTSTALRLDSSRLCPRTSEANPAHSRLESTVPSMA
jgi:chaperonin GroEL